MIDLYWIQPQLESQEPQILEEFDGWEIVQPVFDSEYITKYQVWGELERMLVLAPIRDRRDTLEFIAKKIALVLNK